MGDRERKNDLRVTKVLFFFFSYTTLEIYLRIFQHVEYVGDAGSGSHTSTHLPANPTDEEIQK